MISWPFCLFCVYSASCFYSIFLSIWIFSLASWLLLFCPWLISSKTLHRFDCRVFFVSRVDHNDCDLDTNCSWWFWCNVWWSAWQPWLAILCLRWVPLAQLQFKSKRLHILTGVLRRLNFHLWTHFGNFLQFFLLDGLWDKYT